MRGQIRSPRIASWLLRHFGCSSNNETIVGDLDEHYGRHRSRTWYWKQIVIALMVGFFQEIRTRKLLTVRIMLLNTIVLYIVANTVFNVFGQKVAGIVQAIAELGGEPPLWIYAMFS